MNTAVKPPEERIAELVGMVIVDGDLLSYGQGRSYKAETLFWSAMQHGKHWDWLTAEKCLDDLYRMVKSKNPGTGEAWHQGRHPLQEWMGEQKDYYS